MLKTKLAGEITTNKAHQPHITITNNIMGCNVEIRENQENQIKKTRQEQIFLENGEILEINPSEEKIEVIVKYVGTLDTIIEELSIDVEYLDKNYAIIQVPLVNIEKLSDYPNIIYYELPQDVALMQSLYNDDICINSEVGISKDLKGRGVLISIIDSGIDYKHLDFINEDGTTRIEAIWDQSLDVGKPPESFLGGTLFNRSDINEALESGRSLGHFDNVGHGTAVAGVCCGNGRESNGKIVGIAPECDILVVKLSSKGVGVAKTTDIMRAIKFSYNYAIEMSQPLVINLSFGTSNGVRSGETLFETYINDVAESYISNIVVAMGNEGNTGHHYHNTIKEGDVVDVEFSIQGGVTNFNLIVFKRFIDDMSMQIIAPTGNTTSIFKLTNTTELLRVDDYLLFVNAGSPLPYSIETGIFIGFQNTGTVYDDETWIVRIFGESIIDGKIDMWLPIYELVGKRSFFLQSSLDTTLTIPATVQNVISVAGYNQENDSIVGFSGRGNTITGGIKPDVASPSVDIVTTKSGGGYDKYTGTSFAAPIVSGIVALLLEWGIIRKNDRHLYGQRLKAYLQKGARRPEELKSYPNIEIGYGIVCLDRTLNLLRNDDRIRRGNVVGNLQNIFNNNTSTDENYVDFIVEYTDEILDLINKTNYIKINKIINDEFIIISVGIDKYSQVINDLFIPYKRETSQLFSLCGVSALTASGILEVQQNPPLELTGNGVLIGVIDTGIDYTNKSFINDIGESRIFSMWDQSQEGVPPIDYKYGREITNTEFNRALEDGVYNLTRDENGHGTFIASIMAGSKVSEANIGVAPNAELVVVKLKQAKEVSKVLNFVSSDVTDIYQSTDIIQGIQYLVEKAKELNRPMAICIGLATNTGGHDGGTFIERYLEALCYEYKGFICCAVGNEGLNRRHGKIKLKEGETQIFLFEVAEEKKVCIDIWLKYYEEIEIVITTPNGASTTIIPINEDFIRTKKFTDQKSEIYIVYDRFFNAGTSNAIRVGLVTPESGTWAFELKGIKIIDGELNIWMPTGNMLSEDTYILNAEIENTATIPSSADGMCSVGGYNHRNNSFYSQSGRGGSVYRVNVPTIVAPSVDVLGSYPFYQDTMTGTSVGAAIVTGCGALLLEWGVLQGNLPKINTEVIKNILIKGAMRDDGVEYPNVSTGFGMLNLIDSFEDLL